MFRNYKCHIWPNFQVVTKNWCFSLCFSIPFGINWRYSIFMISLVVGVSQLMARLILTTCLIVYLEFSPPFFFPFPSFLLGTVVEFITLC